MKIIRKLYDWMGRKVDSPYAIWWLSVLFFIESSFLIIPVDPLLILFCVEKPSRSLFYAFVATATSVLGGLFGYFIGAVLWKSVGITLVTWIISETTFYNMVAKYKLYQHWAIFLAGFMPLPYKAVTISAGFCHLPIVPFMFYSILARGGRFFLIASLIKLLGIRVKNFIDRYFNQLVVAFILIFALSCMALK
jgi:membrane protein YqaA with SNARE-associated domain